MSFKTPSRMAGLTTPSSRRATAAVGIWNDSAWIMLDAPSSSCQRELHPFFHPLMYSGHVELLFQNPNFHCEEQTNHQIVIFWVNDCNEGIPIGTISSSDR